MPIGLGLATSHAPTMMLPPDRWKALYNRMTQHTPQPPEVEAETEEVVQSYAERIQNALGELRDRLAKFQADLLIIVGGDQQEMFDRSNVPNLMLFVGDNAWGYNTGGGATPSETNLVRLTVDRETSERLVRGLVCEQGFDVAVSRVQHALTPTERKLPHAFLRPAPWLMPRLDVPVVLLYENTYDPPSLSAQRCYDLGDAIAELLEDDPRRIAVVGSGGLSHDPQGPRSGWVDKGLDRWFLDRLAAGDGRATTAMFKFDSMTMRGGTGEMRAWITVAGAMERRGANAVVVDYVPSHHAVTGLGWAYWEG